MTFFILPPAQLKAIPSTPSVLSFLLAPKPRDPLSSSSLCQSQLVCRGHERVRRLAACSDSNRRSASGSRRRKIDASVNHIVSAVRYRTARCLHRNLRRLPFSATIRFNPTVGDRDACAGARGRRAKLQRTTMKTLTYFIVVQFSRRIQPESDMHSRPPASPPAALPVERMRRSTAAICVDNARIASCSARLRISARRASGRNACARWNSCCPWRRLLALFLTGIRQ